MLDKVLTKPRTYSTRREVNVCQRLHCCTHHFTQSKVLILLLEGVRGISLWWLIVVNSERHNHLLRQQSENFRLHLVVVMIISVYCYYYLAQLGENESEWVSYSYFKGLVSLLNDMELMKKIYLHVSDKGKDKEITQGKPKIGSLFFHFVIGVKLHQTVDQVVSVRFTSCCLSCVYVLYCYLGISSGSFKPKGISTGLLNLLIQFGVVITLPIMLELSYLRLHHQNKFARSTTLHLV